MNTYRATWPSLAELGTTIEQALRRIGLRGSWRIQPPRDDGPGIVLDWVIKGQRGNPFAPSVVVEGDDIAALVAEVLAKSEPERGGLDWTVPWCIRKREQAEEERRRFNERMEQRRADQEALKAAERVRWAEERERRRRQDQARSVLG